ncbi:GNAT family N-acetyltransferase [Yeosuana marina]|uniref:GNAT family N-acetyltransferase n=1 Tax=Yeosuana marina TaxID=1565536 RepID=UPI0030ED1AB1|tara:strand:+ start:2029 stop:3000 length:972 start_codon:yes stop_codon:yes gene_type:complete
MQSYEVIKYSTQFYDEWNKFVMTSKNATFLFHRDFMEYHQDRFEDYSLMVYNNKKLIAIFPSNIENHIVYSHKGLSYGGFLVQNKIRIKDFIFAFKSLLMFLENRKIEKLYLKKIPTIYHKYLSEEMDYILSVLDAKEYTNDSYFVIDDLSNYEPNRNRKRAIKIFREKELVISNEGIDFFWEHILKKNLKDRFGVDPVHTIDEIKYLMEKFPKNIVFFSAKFNDEILAGVVMFITDNVAHFQYSSGTDSRSQNGSLDAIFNYIIKAYNDKKYISFGSSSTDNSLKIKKGLAYWKESFGATLTAQKSYIINTGNHLNLSNIFK